MSDVNLMAEKVEECSHYPGPWMVGEISKNENPLMIYCDDSLGSRVASCCQSGHGISSQQDLANARLIAAAPELLAALKAAQKDLETVQREMSGIAPEAVSPALPLIRDAVAKAEGRS